VYAAQPFDRPFRDIHTTYQHVIASPRVYDTAGRVLLGLDAQDPLF
jgi:hypothetical protein